MTNFFWIALSTALVSVCANKNGMTTKAPPQTIPQHLVERFPELTTLHKRTTTPSANQIDPDDSKPATVLEYKPITSFYHPHPVTVGQIVPSGTPWPSEVSSTTKPKPTLAAQPFSEDEFTTIRSEKPQETSAAPNDSSKATTQKVNIDERFPEIVNTKITEKFETASNTYPAVDLETTEYIETNQKVEEQTTFDYEPRPTTRPQSSGKPTLAENQTDVTPNLEDRFPEVSSVSTTTSAATTASSVSTRLILTYRPQRPWYHPRPGNVIGQIIPPGKPWPASPAGYPSFSATTLPPWLKDANESPSLSHEKNALSLKEESLKGEFNLEPNALQYYGPPITAPSRSYSPAPPPFTSGSRKTTISDLADILKEAHHLKINENASVSPSHLLPFDIESGVTPPTIKRPPPPAGHQRLRTAYRT